MEESEWYEGAYCLSQVQPVSNIIVSILSAGAQVVRIMKSFIVLLALAAIAAGIYFTFIKDSGPYASYKTSATALANGDRGRALQYADGPQVLGGPEENRGQTAGGMPVDALVGIGYSRESETKNSDGTVTVKAIQSVRFDPPGATSAMGAMTAKYR